MEEMDRIGIFQKATSAMIATTERAYNSSFYRDHSNRAHEYTKEDAERIIVGGDILAQRKMSRDFYAVDGFYKRILIYYATLLKYAGILIPSPSNGQKMGTESIKKRYYKALDYTEKMKIPSICTNIALAMLINGTYYGVVQQLDKDGFTILDLPIDYCRSRFKDLDGNDIVEFNVAYFDTIPEGENRKAALSSYPHEVSRAYRKYHKSPSTNPKWIFISPGTGLCFKFPGDNRPLFLNMIPTTIDYENALETERERDEEEIKKIVVQKIPHNNENALLFEPEEAVEIHRGTVEMMKKNKNVSVLTTYADVDSIVSKTASDSVSNNLEKMVNNIYYKAGVSGSIFGSNSNLAIDYSINNDMALMMVMAEKFANLFTAAINKLFANASLNFKYTILPISYYNSDKYVDSAFKLASSGYSFILPAIALGLSQKDLVNIKDLENDVLKLDEKLIPLASAFTASANQGKPGAPEKSMEEKAPKTIKNETSIDKQGGSD